MAKKNGPAFSRSSHPEPETSNTPVSAAIPPQPPTSSEPKPRYGIEDAIKLMRRLPREDVSLVASIVRETLESTNIKVDAIIADAEKKEKSLDEHVNRLNEEITELEDMIKKRYEQINGLKSDLEETRQVKKDLAVVQDDQFEDQVDLPDLEIEPLGVAEDSVG